MTPSQEAREYPPLPRPTGWITNWKDFLARRDGVIYSYMWRPDGKPHPLDVQMFTAEQVYACIDADRKARQQEALDALRGLDSDTRVRFYEHDFYVLSNFSAFSLKIEGIRFDTSEHAYHWMKFGTQPDDEPAERWAEREKYANAVRYAESAHEAFKVAERYKAHRRPDWDDVKVGIMLEILRAKAEQHEYVRRKLLATGDRELVEDSWRDDFWGWGPNRDGKNMLGRLWMRVRDELRAAIAKGASHE